MRYVYCNNAAGAYPVAPGTVEAVTRAMREPPRVSGRGASASSDSLMQCRERLARLMDADPSQVVLTSGATYGLNAALLGLGLRQGDLVITTVMEHNSILRPLAYLEELWGIRVETVSLNADAKLDEERYNALLSEKPRLVALTHSSNVTGRVNPVRQWFQSAKAAGAATLLDASQTAGRIPVIPGELCADLAAFSGHKGLRGPLGTGALYVSPQITLAPVFTGGTGVKSDLRLHPEEMPMRLEPGTPSTAAFAGLEAAISYYTEHACEIAGQEASMAEQLFAGLSAIPKVRIYDKDPHGRLPVISFSIDGMDSETAGFALSESFGIECRSGLHCAPLMHKALDVAGTVRLSPSYMNTPGDMGYVLEAVRKVAL